MSNQANFRRAAIVETRIYDNPASPATSPYDVALPITVLDAVFDADTGQSLTEILQALPAGRPTRTYGVHIDLNNSNPYTAVTYIGDAVGMVGGSPTWDTMPIFQDIRPCLFNNGAVVGYLNPDNFEQWHPQQDLTGLPATPDITSGDAGDVMIEIPRVGWRIDTVGDIMTVQITNEQNTPGYRYFAHTRNEGGDRNFLYVGAYKGIIQDNRLRSISGATPTVQQGLGAFRTAANANGVGYDQMAFFPLMLLQILYLIRFKSLNSQAALGNGRTGATEIANTGSTNTKGMNWGTTANAIDPVKCLGIEDLWGNVSEGIDGIFSDVRRDILTAFQDFNDTGQGYVNRGNAGTMNFSGFTTRVQGTSEMGFIPRATGGSETTFFSDRCILTASSVGTFGGNWGSGGGAGVFYFGWIPVVVTVTAEGARLMFL